MYYIDVTICNEYGYRSLGSTHDWLEFQGDSREFLMKDTGLDQITEKPSRILWRKHKNTGMSTGKGWLRVLLMKTQRWTTPTEGSYKVNFDENLFGNLGKLSAGVRDSWGKVLAAMPSLGHMGREAIEVEALAA